MAKRKKSYTNKKINKQINKIISLVLALIIAALTAKYTVLDEKYQPVIGTVQGRVVKVADGDTITLLTPDFKEAKIRLYGVDAPETKQDFGGASQKALAGLIAGKEVEVDVIDIDQYGRSVGRVTLGGVDINQTMLEQGYVWLYPQYCKIEKCKEWKEIQASVKENKKGLWRQPKAQAPWQWRKENK